jgi:MFS family permease
VANVAPPEARGTVIATWVGFARFGQTVGPLGTGVGLDAAGPRWVFGIGAGIATLLALGQSRLLAAAGDSAAAEKLASRSG